MTDPVIFALAVLAVLGTPGPTNTLLAASGALTGIKRSLPLLAAEIGGYLFTVILVGTMLGPVIASLPWVGVGLRCVMALYLAYLALRLWNTVPPPQAQTGSIGFAAVFTTTLLNPKGLVFALVIIPFGQHGVITYLAGFAGLVFVAGFSWVLVGALAGAAASKTPTALITRSASVALAIFAGLTVASLFR